MQVEGAGVDRLADSNLFSPGIGAGRIKKDGKATGVVLPDQGTAHTVLCTEPLTLLILHTARAQTLPHLRMAFANSDIAPLGRHFELLSQGYGVNGQQQCGDQQEEATQYSH